MPRAWAAGDLDSDWFHVPCERGDAWQADATGPPDLQLGAVHLAHALAGGAEALRRYFTLKPCHGVSADVCCAVAAIVACMR